jgi:hypothetical protein
MRDWCSGNIPLSKRVDVGSIPTSRAVNKNTEQGFVFLFTVAKRQRNRTSGELAKRGRGRACLDKNFRVYSFSL